jgi:hypothetical protein
MSTWQDLVTASLIGTERSAVPLVAVPGVPTPADAPADPAAILLDRAALLTVARRGGRQAEQAEPLPPAEPDPAPAVGRAAARRLARMLSGEHPDVLAEWLAAVVARGRRAPAALLPALLDRARRSAAVDPELRRLAAEAGGSRARWLAGFNPDWKFVTAHARPGDDAWRLGGKGQRRGYLAGLRARDPGAARDLIAQSWAAASPDERVMFLKTMTGGLSLADEPLLEAALDDPNAWVRKMAAEVLSALPGSALGRRMADRALGCLRLHEGTRGTRLVATPPAQCDAAMRRDGIAPGPSATSSHPAGPARLMAEVLARTPLRTWTDGFGRPPEQILALPSGGWAPVLLAGWSQAAMDQRDQDWMTALVSRVLTNEPPGMQHWTETLRQLVRRVDPRLGALGTTASPDAELSPAARDAVRVLRFRYDMLKELDDDHSAG